MQLKLAAVVVVCVVLILLRRLLLTLVWQHIDDMRTRYMWRKNITSGIVVCGVLFAAGLILEAGQSLATYLGLLTAGLAVALNDPLSNLVGWAFILWRKPFEFGDRIQIGEFAGDVVDIRMFQFSLLEIGNWVISDQSTGRVIHIPNRRVFQEPLCNYTGEFPFIWNEISVTVTFESNWRRAKSILQAIADETVSDISTEAAQTIKEVNRRFMIGYTVLTPAVYTDVIQYGVRLTLRYLCPPRRRRGTTQILWEAILDAFAADTDVAFAYPTQRFFDQYLEGKPGPYPADPSGEVVV